MTTCLAIEPPNRKSVWLFSDYQITNLDDGNPDSKYFQSKLIHAKNWAMAGAGVRSASYTLFVKYMCGSKTKEIERIFGKDINCEDTINNAIKNREFPEVYRLNFDLAKEDTDTETWYTFLLTGFFGTKPYMATINPLGKVFPVSLDNSLRRVAVGSGSSIVTDYIDKKIEGGGIIIEELNEQKTFEIGYEAMLEASKDPYTGGDPQVEGPVDFLRINSSGVDLYGEGLINAMKKASKDYRREMFDGDLMDLLDT